MYLCNNLFVYTQYILVYQHRLSHYRYPFGLAGKKHWSSANVDENKELCHRYLHILLQRVEVSLLRETRDKQYAKSHFQLIDGLKEDVKELLAVKSFDRMDPLRCCTASYR